MPFRRYVPSGARFRTSLQNAVITTGRFPIYLTDILLTGEYQNCSSFIIMSLCRSSLRVGSSLSSLRPVTLRLTSNLHIHSQPSTHPRRAFSSSMPLRALIQPVFSPEAIHRKCSLLLHQPGADAHRQQSDHTPKPSRPMASCFFPVNSQPILKAS